MNRFIRFFNQNRKVIYWSIAVIAFILILIQLLNSYAENSHKKNTIDENQENIKASNSENKNRKSQNNSTNATSTNSALIYKDSLTLDDQISDRALTDDSNLIQSFITYCNNQQLEEAYSLLSDDCKEELYTDIDNFKNLYYDVMFNGNKKNITIENWNKRIYRVKFYDDNIIATGNLNGGSTPTDYFTIVLDSEGNEKLNISSFIGKKEINKEVENQGVKIKAQYLYQYMDYCEIQYDVKNGTEQTVLLDDLSIPYTIYIKDTEDNKYSADTGILTQERLKLVQTQEKQIKIKYYSGYISTKTISNITFSKVINDYDAFNQENYDQYFEISMNVEI